MGQWGDPTGKNSVGDRDRERQAFHDALRAWDGQICGCSERLSELLFLAAF